MSQRDRIDVADLHDDDLSDIERMLEDDIPLTAENIRRLPRRDTMVTTWNAPAFREEELRMREDPEDRNPDEVRTVDGRYFPEGRRRTTEVERVRVDYGRTRSRVCRWYNSDSGCWNGDRCRFAHIDEAPHNRW